MADILIRGMETPESCFECVLSHSFFRNLHCNELEGMSGFIGHLPHMNDRHPDCPIVPLQEGHGRLIDADAFKADCLAATKEAKPDFIRHEDWLKSCAITMSFCRDIDEQPTIVPAEGGTDDET